MREQREGVLVKPYQRLSESEVNLVDEASRRILEEQGILSYNKQAVEILRAAGAKVTPLSDCARIHITSSIVNKALDTAPSTVVLGARDPANKLILDGTEPRVRFGSGAETNIWLDVSYDDGRPVFTRQKGTIERLCQAAHICENLEHLDFFIRCVNIQDDDVTPDNKDVNKFLASFNNITKHVQGGLTRIDRIEDVLRMAEIIAGGKDAFEAAPIISFITCAIKSPLQMVEDAVDTFIEIAKRRVPVVISSCPMGGATGPFDEFGMVSLINAELLAGITVNQLVSPGAPILYGAVPVRTRLDNLNDMYGAPEFNHYNIDCAQMARFYEIPCYSTAGVGDTSTPGIQATVEKLITYASVPRGGAQYIHYAFGLLERTNVFCPEQAVMDDAHIGIAKHMLKEPEITGSSIDETLAMMKGVMESSHRTFMYHLPLPSREAVYVKYPLENEEGDALLEAHRVVAETMALPRKSLPPEVQEEIRKEIPGVLETTLKGE